MKGRGAAPSGGGGGGGGGGGLVGPGAPWNGVAGSGFTSAEPTPNHASRTPTNPMPPCKWWTAPNQRFTTNPTVGVFTDGYGGIASVDFWVEGSTPVNVSTLTLNTELDPHGNPKNLPGYWVTLDIAAFLAKITAGTFGAVKIYARSNPSNPALQAHVHTPIVIYVSTAAYDFRYLVGSGQTYSTFDAVLTRIATVDHAEHPEIYFTSGGNQEMVDRAGAYDGCKSYCRVIAAAGQTVNFQRTTRLYNAPYPGDQSAQSWRTNFDKLQFEGSNIWLDYKNIDQWDTYSRPGRLYGCKVYNSENEPSALTWRRNPRPANGVAQNSYIEFCEIHNIGNPIGSLREGHAIGNMIDNIDFSYAKASYFVAYNYLNKFKWPPVQKGRAFMSLHYTGSATTAHCRIGALMGGIDGKVIMEEDGVEVARYDVANTTDPAINPLVYGENLVTKINLDLGARGWVSTGLEAISVLASAYAFTPAASVGTMSDGSDWTYNVSSRTDCKGQTLGLMVSVDHHVDFTQFDEGQSYPNVVILGNVSRDIGFMNPSKGPGVPRDMIFSENIFYQDGDPNGQQGGFGGDHCLYRNNTCIGKDAINNVGFIAYPVTDSSQFCLVDGYVGPLVQGAYDAGAIPIINSYLQYFASAGLPAYAGCSNNSGVVWSGTSNTALVVNAAAGDFRPAGALLTTKISKNAAYDASRTGRAGTDARGAWSINASAPNWPF